VQSKQLGAVEKLEEDHYEQAKSVLTEFDLSQIENKSWASGELSIQCFTRFNLTS
jgi:hypothetical protein